MPETPTTEPTPPKRDGVRAMVGRAPALMRGVVAAAGGIATLATVLFLIRPDLQPRAPEPTAPPPVRRGQLDDLRLGRTTPLGPYCRAKQEEVAFELGCPVDDRRTAAVGRVVRYQVGAEGLPGVPLTLTWTMVEAASGDPLGDPALVDRDAWPIGVVTPELSGLDAIGGEVWVPLPTGAGPFAVELVLHDDRGAVLDAEVSPAFAGLAGDGGTPAPQGGTP